MKVSVKLLMENFFRISNWVELTEVEMKQVFFVP